MKFRGSGWPGYFEADDSNGKKIKIPYFKAWGDSLSKDENIKCMYCENPFPQEADIIVGDPWGDEFKNEEKGKSLVIIRSNRAIEIFESLEKDKEIYSSKSSYEDVKRYQKNLLKRYDEFKVIALIYKKIHKEKIFLKDYKEIVKENPKNILRYIKNLRNYKNVYSNWKYE